VRRENVRCDLEEKSVYIYAAHSSQWLIRLELTSRLSKKERREGFWCKFFLTIYTDYVHRNPKSKVNWWCDFVQIYLLPLVIVYQNRFQELENYTW